MAQAGDVAREVLPGGLGWQNAAGNVLGIYLHGLFEDPAALQALFGARLHGPVPTLDAVFERMATSLKPISSLARCKPCCKLDTLLTFLSSMTPGVP